MKIKVDVRTNSSQAYLEKINELSYKAYIHSIPEAGKANKELIKVIADHFGVARGGVEIVSGLRSKRKIVNITSI